MTSDKRLEAQKRQFPTFTHGGWQVVRDEFGVRIFTKWTHGQLGAPAPVVTLSTTIEEGMNPQIVSIHYYDACLIAAAPDMFDAINEYLEWGSMTSSDRFIHEQAFRKALAKARGEGAIQDAVEQLKDVQGE